MNIAFNATALAFIITAIVAVCVGEPGIASLALFYALFSAAVFVAAIHLKEKI